MLWELMGKIITLIIGIFITGSCMAEGIFIHSHNEVSNRFALLDETDNVAFLYLTEPGEQSPSKDAIAYMRIRPPVKFDWKTATSNGEPPLLPIEFASEKAVITNTNTADFFFKWSLDGNAVVLNYKNEPIAFVAASESTGFSKAVSIDNALTNAWNQVLYTKYFD